MRGMCYEGYSETCANGHLYSETTCTIDAGI